MEPYCELGGHGGCAFVVAVIVGLALLARIHLGGRLGYGRGIFMVRLIVCALVFVVAAYASIWLMWIDGRPSHGTDRARRIRRLRAVVFPITGVALAAFIAVFLTHRPLS